VGVFVRVDRAAYIQSRLATKGVSLSRKQRNARQDWHAFQAGIPREIRGPDGSRVVGAARATAPAPAPLVLAVWEDCFQRLHALLLEYACTIPVRRSVDGRTAKLSNTPPFLPWLHSCTTLQDIGRKIQAALEHQSQRPNAIEVGPAPVQPPRCAIWNFHTTTPHSPLSLPHETVRHPRRA